MSRELAAIFVGIGMGTLTRLLLLRSDYRSYPSSPNGVLIHLTIGFIASSLGAVALPALLKRDFVAVTFLVLAIQQLREVRKIERESLLDLENTELVRRGNAYIDGLAKGFESRNYVALIVALSTTSFFLLTSLPLWQAILFSTVTGAGVLWAIGRLTGHETVGKYAHVALAELHMKGSNLYAGNVFLANIGLTTQADRVLHGGIGLILTPKSDACQIMLANYGQRQAMVHELAKVLGVKRFYGMRRDFDTGRVALYFVPISNDPATAVRVLESVPLIESVKRDLGKQLPSTVGEPNEQQ